MASGVNNGEVCIHENPKNIYFIFTKNKCSLRLFKIVALLSRERRQDEKGGKKESGGVIKTKRGSPLAPAQFSLEHRHRVEIDAI